MRFAVVIPVYNRASMILEALDSVRGQARPPDRVIVVDDGSTDGTPDAVADWIAVQQPRFPVQCIRQANAGPGAARNTGILAASDCDYIAFLDSDDLWPASHLQEAERFFAAHPGAVAYAGQCLEVFEDAQGRVVSQRLISLPLPFEKQGPAAFNEAMSSTTTTVARRDVLIRVGLFDHTLRYAEDKLLFLKVYCKGDWGRVAAEPVIYRNKIKSIESGQLSNRPHGRSRILFARRLEKELNRMRREPDTVYTNGIDEAIWKALHRAGREYDRRGNARLALAYYARAWRYRRASKTLGRLVGAWIRAALRARRRPS